MKFLEQVLGLTLFPLLSFANANKVESFFENGKSIFNKILYYELFSFDNQSVTLANLFIGLIVLIIGLKLAKYLRNIFKRKLFSIISLDLTSANLMSRVIDYSFMAIVITIALDIAKVPVTAFTFIGGAFVVSIGLSIQHLINNFISGIALIAESKVKVGDLIAFQEIIGRVTNIEARMVEIRTQDNIQYFIPHSKLMQEQFANWTYNGEVIRVSTSVKIDQKDNFNNEFQNIALNAIIHNRNVLASPEPQILLASFEDNILNYEINFWINLANSDRKRVISEVNVSIFNALKAHNISLAIPSRRYVE